MNFSKICGLIRAGPGIEVGEIGGAGSGLRKSSKSGEN